jgi:predicted transposase YbfD/YdcC
MEKSRANLNKNIYMAQEIEDKLNEIAAVYAREGVEKVRRGAGYSQSRVIQEMIAREYARIFGGNK